MLTTLPLLTAIACAPGAADKADPGDDSSAPVDSTPGDSRPDDSGEPQELGLVAGFRASPYGGAPFPEPGYWREVAGEMAGRFDGATPGGVWIVGVTGDDGTCYLSFPSPGGSVDHVAFSGEDANEEALSAFDRAGVKVWLQVESGDASVSDLIGLVMDRYGHHESVLGFGVDVEWFRWLNNEGGKAITDENAESWVGLLRDRDPSDTLFLKHWLVDRMPPTHRDGVIFVNDGQGVGSLDELVSYFASWGEHFSPSPVGFQFGYATDQVWWSDYSDPPERLGEAFLGEIPNTRALLWVDFTVTEVFPP